MIAALGEQIVSAVENRLTNLLLLDLDHDETRL